MLIANCESKETILFHIPDGRGTTQAPSCKEIMMGLGKENEGISPAAYSSSGAGSPLKQGSPNKVIILPPGKLYNEKEGQRTSCGN